jgi:hypothetical protein
LLFGQEWLYCVKDRNVNEMNSTETEAADASMPQAPKRRWSPHTAAFLSFIFPGWGQIYKGQVKNGIFWMIITIAAYFYMVIPGVILQLLCTIEAAVRNVEK